MTNLDQFIIHSAYPVEKIIWTAEGVLNNTNPYWYDVFGGYVFEPITNEVDARDILIDGVWTSDDWATQYPINTNSRIMGYEGSDSEGYSALFDTADATVFADGIYIPIEDFYVPYQCVGIRGEANGGRTVQYRLWAYIVESDWATQSNNKTAEDLAHSFQKNTNLAQLNMISENILTIPSGQTAVINHNLGFRPFCKMWRRNGGYIDGGTWQKNYLLTVFDPSNPYTKNKITIDAQKVSIYAEDTYDGTSQDFLIRIFNYALPS